MECKTLTGEQRKAQKNYQRMIRTLGGIYILARSSEQAVSELRKELGI